MKQRTLAKDVSSIVGSNIVVRVLSSVVAIVSRRLLGPELTGVWNLIEVLRLQISSITVGIHYSADRDMPVYRARGEAEKESALRSLTFSYLLLEVAVIGLGFFAYSYFYGSQYRPEIRTGLLIMPLLLVFTRITTFYQLAIKNAKAFGLYAWSNLVLFALDASIVLYIVFAGLVGVFVGLVVNGVARSVFYWYVTTRGQVFRVRWRVRWEEIKILLPFGIPAGMWNLAYMFLLRLDSLSVSWAFGTTALGYYYLGPQLAASLSEAPNALSIISYPNLMEEFGRNGMGSVRAHTSRYSRILMYLIVPLTISAGYFGVGLLVKYFLPKFGPGLEAVKVSLLVLSFSSAGYIYMQVLLAAKWLKTLIGITVASVLLMGTVIRLWALGTGQLVDFAWANVFAQFSFFLLVLLAAYKAMTGKVFGHVGEWGKTVLASVLWVFLLRIIDAVLPAVSGSRFQYDALVVMSKESLFLAGVVLSAFLLERDFAQQVVHGVSDRLLARFPRLARGDEVA